jgi:hypothetical protein
MLQHLGSRIRDTSTAATCSPAAAITYVSLLLLLLLLLCQLPNSQASTTRGCTLGSTAP